MSVTEIAIERVTEQQRVVVFPQSCEQSRHGLREFRSRLIPGRAQRRAKPLVLCSCREIEGGVARVEACPHVRVHVHDEEIEPSVAVVVEDFAADCAVRRAAERLGGDVGEGAVSAVVIELAPAEHVGDEDVEEPVLVVVEHRGVAGPAPAAQTGAGGLVGEGTVPIVVVEDVEFFRGGHEGAEVRLSLKGVRRGVEDVGGPAAGVGEEEIELAVVVVVEEDGGLEVADPGEPGGRGDVLERAVAAVVEQHVAAPRAGHEQRLPAGVVVVGEGGPDADAVAKAHARLGGDVGEGAVAVVAEQGVGPQLVAEVDGVPADLVQKVDVFAAVVVVIADREAGAVIVEIDVEGLALFFGQEMHPERDSRFARAFLKSLAGRRLIGTAARGADQCRRGERQGDGGCGLA